MFCWHSWTRIRKLFRTNVLRSNDQTFITTQVLLYVVFSGIKCRISSIQSERQVNVGSRKLPKCHNKMVRGKSFDAKSNVGRSSGVQIQERCTNDIWVSCAVCCNWWCTYFQWEVGVIQSVCAKDYIMNFVIIMIQLVWYVFFSVTAFF